MDIPDNALEILKKLATLIMCLRSHQDQAASRVESWIDLIRHRNEALRASQTVRYPSPPQTPTRNLDRHRLLHTGVLEESDADTPESIESFWSSNRKNQSPESIATTPERGSFQEVNINSPSAQRERRRRSKRFTSGPTAAAPQMQKKSMTGSELSSSSYFGPLELCGKSASAASVLYFQTLRKQLTDSDRHHGYIYGYRRDGCELIEIGHTKSVEDRMKRWALTCEYMPIVKFQVETDYAQRVERLIQTHNYLI